jgi:hypothetical protein
LFCRLRGKLGVQADNLSITIRISEGVGLCGWDLGKKREIGVGVRCYQESLFINYKVCVCTFEIAIKEQLKESFTQNMSSFVYEYYFSASKTHLFTLPIAHGFIHSSWAATLA